MNLEKQLSSLLTAALLCGTFTPFASAQQIASTQPVAQPSVGPAVSSPAEVAASEAALLKSTPPLTEDALRSRYVGKLIYMRGAYLGDDLSFSQDGKVIGSPAVGSFTLSAFEVQKVTLSKHKLEIEADRYGLHYLGALPFEDQSKAYDRVKISKKPVHISIEREVIVIPKKKKEKKVKEPSAKELAAAQTLKTRDAARAVSPVGSSEMPKPVAEAPKAVASNSASEEAYAALVAVAPAHSAMVMNKALDTVFANDMDQSMLSKLPDYWQEYFTSKSKHRAFMPADTNIKVLSEAMMPPKVLNKIDPSSNEYAQKYGIAGMALVRTVVDASGAPQQIAISRPIGFGLDEQAVDAVKKSHFKPAMLNGQPVPVVIDLVVTFRIFSNRTKPGSVTKDSQETVFSASAAEMDGPKPSAQDANLTR
jgi:TonB family protein